MAEDRRRGKDEVKEEEDEGLRQRVEESLSRFLPEVVKRTFDLGLETISSASEKSRIKNLVSDMKLPRDVSTYLLSQLDDTKNALLRVFAGEVRDFLENTDMAEDMRKVLTSVSLEVSTRVRFVPNDSGLKAEVETKDKDEKNKK